MSSSDANTAALTEPIDGCAGPCQLLPTPSSQRKPQPEKPLKCYQKFVVGRANALARPVAPCFAFVGARALILNKLNSEAANRCQQQCVDEAAFVQQELLDYPDGEKEGTYVPEHCCLA